MRVVGIDPGLTGGIACIDQDGTLVALADLPVQRAESLAYIDGQALQRFMFDNVLCGRRDNEQVQVWIERVSAMPKQGVSSSFQFGLGFGSVIGCIQTMLLPIHFVTAAKWKRDLNLYGKDAGGKAASLDRARRLWPTADLGLKKHEGRAEALLIAAWAINKGRG